MVLEVLSSSLGDLAGEVIGSYGKQPFWVLFNVLGLDLAGEEHSLLDLNLISFIMHVDGGGSSLLLICRFFILKLN